MPTAYTDIILSLNNCSFKTYLFRCSRAFGACMSQRDDPLNELPRHWKYDGGYLRSAEKYQKELDELNLMTLEEVKEAYNLEYQESVEYRDRIRKQDAVENAKYAKMLAEVECWNPPSVHHEELKKFMKEQIMLSMNKSDDDSFWTVEKISPREWFNEKKNYLKNKITSEIKRHRDMLDKEKEMVEWMVRLYSSVGESYNV